MAIRRWLALRDDAWCVLAGPRHWNRAECERIVGTAQDPDAALTAAFGAWTTHLEMMYATDGPDDLPEALEGWHQFLTRIDSIFVRIGPTSLERDLRDAVARLVVLIAEVSYCEDAWYDQVSVAIKWLETHLGIDSYRSEISVPTLISDVFESWVEPTAGATEQVAGDIAREFAVLHAAPRPDALERWLEDRRRPFDLAKPAGSVSVDAHHDHIFTVDRGRDPDRAHAMRIALDACRRDASANRPLDVAALMDWQAVVLPGEPIAIRDRDAFAKRGVERYGTPPDLEARFAAALRDADNVAQPVLLRAARLYLDVCYFHPFADGNARAARLALDHFLTRRGLGLRGIRPILVPWRVDIEPLFHLTRVLSAVVGRCDWLQPAMYPY